MRGAITTAYLCAALACAMWPGLASAQSERVLTVASYGGQIDEAYKKALAGFEKRWK